MTKNRTTIKDLLQDGVRPRTALDWLWRQSRSFCRLGVHVFQPPRELGSITALMAPAGAQRIVVWAFRSWPGQNLKPLPAERTSRTLRQIPILRVWAQPGHRKSAASRSCFEDGEPRFPKPLL